MVVGPVVVVATVVASGSLVVVTIPRSPAVLKHDPDEATWADIIADEHDEKVPTLDPLDTYGAMMYGLVLGKHAVFVLESWSEPEQVECDEKAKSR